MKSICHICNNYVSSKVHQNLILEISKREDYFQEIYIPVRGVNDLGKNKFNKERVNFHYFNYKFIFLKFLPLIKILIVSFFYLWKFKKSKFDFIFCHNLWSDGMIAFINYIFKKTPYVLVVRNTDMNVFLPKLVHYRWLIKLMVKKSDGLVFVNNVYMERFKFLYPSIFNCAKKVEIIPNGVDNFWIENFIEKNDKINKSRSLLYVGAFNENKNIKGIFDAIEILNKKNINFEMYFVGGTESDFKKLLNLKHIPSYIKVIDKTTDKNKLLEMYRRSQIFIMPSFFETFGLVYVEALLQRCAVIHSKGQGIDGMIKSNLVISVDPFNINDISEKIEYLLNNYENISVNNDLFESLIAEFNWYNISNKYLSYFKDVKGNN